MYFSIDYTLLKVVSHYDLSILSMSVMGFQNKLGLGGWGELCPVYFFFHCCNLASMEDLT